MASLIDDVGTAAAWIAAALRSSGYSADFSPASLWVVDRFVDDHSSGGQPRPGGLLAKDLGKRLFALGAYVGEVLRSTLGGTWQADDSDPQGEINVALVLPDGSVVWPVQRVIKRYRNGDEDSIGVYGAGLGLPVGPRPA